MQRILPPDSVRIPKDASLVFKGLIFDVYQWQQEMFDGSKATFEMLRRPDSLSCIVLKDDKVLVLEDEQPHRGKLWTFPGGRRADGESWLDGIKRELYEEAGIKCKTWKLLYAQQFTRKIEHFGAIYVATDITSEEPNHPDSDGEKITLHWLPYETFRTDALAGKYKFRENAAEILEKYPTVASLLQAPEFTGISD